MLNFQLADVACTFKGDNAYPCAGASRTPFPTTAHFFFISDTHDHHNPVRHDRDTRGSPSVYSLTSKEISVVQ